MKGSPMTTMQTSFGTVSYTDEGSGPPIVLLHAALHDRTDFAPVADALGNGRRVIALDWPGHGESPLPATPLRAVEFGDLLIEFGDRLDLTNAVIVGNSVGGYAACRLALERPERVAGVVLINNGGFTPHNGVPRFFRRLPGPPGVNKAVFPGFVRAYMRAKNPTDQAVVDRVVARAKTDGGAHRGGVVEELHRPRPRPPYARRSDQRTGADHLGHQGCHRATTMGQGGTGRHSGVSVRDIADRPRRLLVGTRGVAGNRPAVRRRRARRACRAPQLTHVNTAARTLSQRSWRIVTATVELTTVLSEITVHPRPIQV